MTLEEPMILLYSEIRSMIGIDSSINKKYDLDDFDDYQSIH